MRIENERFHSGREGLTISTARLEDNGIYICNVINSEGSKEHRVKVGVTSPPNLVPNNNNKEINITDYLGGRSAFTCIAEGIGHINKLFGYFFGTFGIFFIFGHFFVISLREPVAGFNLVAQWNSARAFQETFDSL